MLFIMLPFQCLIVEKVMGLSIQIWTIIPIPLSQCIQWQWKWVHSQKVLTFMSICIIIIGLMWGALHALCHLIPKTLYQAKSSVKPRYIQCQKHYLSVIIMLLLQKKSVEIHRRNRKDHFSRILNMTYLNLQFLFPPCISQSPSSRLSFCVSFSILPIWLITPLQVHHVLH